MVLAISGLRQLSALWPFPVFDFWSLPAWYAYAGGRVFWQLVDIFEPGLPTGCFLQADQLPPWLICQPGEIADGGFPTSEPQHLIKALMSISARSVDLPFPSMMLISIICRAHTLSTPHSLPLPIKTYCLFPP